MQRLFGILLLCTAASFAQMNVNGRVESVLIDAQDGAPVEKSYNVINHGDPTFLWRFRGYLDMQVSERSYIFTDIRLQPDGLQVDFAAIRLYFNDNQTFGVQTGVLGTFIGNVTARRSSKYNPLIHLPIMYDYYTALPDDPQSSPYELFEQRGTGTGLPIFYLGVYRPGVELFATVLEKIDLHAGVYNSSPSNPYMAYSASDFNYSARIGIRPVMGLNMGLSYNYGPFMGQDEYSYVDVSGAIQSLYDVDVSYERGYFSFFGQAVLNTWEHPTLPDDLGVFSYYLEGKYKFAPHAFAAVRYGHSMFSEFEIHEQSLPWDDNIQRIEVGLGYYLERETLAKIVYQHNRTERIDPRDDYVALELSAGF